MYSDPTAYIILAALLGGSIGFFGCALYASRRIREIESNAWSRGRQCTERENSSL